MHQDCSCNPQGRVSPGAPAVTMQDRACPWQPQPCAPCATSATAPAPPQEGKPWPGQGQRRRWFGTRVPGAATDAWLAKPAIPTAPSTSLMKTLKVKDHRVGLLYPA